MIEKIEHSREVISEAINQYPKIAHNNLRTETQVVHAGERDRKRQNRSVTMPLEQTAAYYFDNTRQIRDFYNGKLEGIKYGRYGCPIQHAVEQKMAELEGGDRSLLFSSGMNATTTAILSLLKKGDHLIFLDECYRNTRNFFLNILPRYGIEASALPINKSPREYLKSNTKLFFAELPTNPFLRVIDLDDIVQCFKNRKIITIIDSTFATPINIQPLKYGIDLIIHSATKYLGGHHDLFAGVAVGKSKIVAEIQKYRDIFGGIIDPHAAFLLLRSLQTLSVRMEKYNQNGLIIANYLQDHKKVGKVWYPGLNSHPDYSKAKKQMIGFGGVITFSCLASEQKTSKFIDSLKIPYISSNFGGPQSLIEQHAILTFFKDRDLAKKHNINGNLIRYSLGFENVNDVTDDFEQAFNKI